MTKRYAIGLEYDGNDYYGWQKQEQVASIQSAVEAAIGQIANHPVNVVCAGRTDRGVHALQQIIHFDTTAERTDYAWLMGINRFLPSTISAHWIQPVAADFHARFSARARRYAYVLYCGPVRPGLIRQQTTWLHRKIDLPAMQQAATYLLGEHDFASFQGTHCQAKTSIRTVLNIELINNSPLLIVDIKANAFLQHMVRNIVGSLLEVGLGRQPPEWIIEVLAARDRQAAAITAPATGLYFLAVDYPEHFGIPKQMPFAWFRKGT